MSWRPDGWKNPHLSGLELDGEFITGDIRYLVKYLEYEAGADAMYEALKSAGTHYTQEEGVGIGFVLRNPSTIVIIPDEEAKE